MAEQASPGIQVLTSEHSDWISTSDENDVSTGREVVDARLRQLLGAERLVIVSGLGTSLCIAPQGSSKPPTMKDLWAQA